MFDWNMSFILPALITPLQNLLGMLVAITIGYWLALQRKNTAVQVAQAGLFTLTLALGFLINRLGLTAPPYFVFIAFYLLLLASLVLFRHNLDQDVVLSLQVIVLFLVGLKLAEPEQANPYQTLSVMLFVAGISFGAVRAMVVVESEVVPSKKVT